MKLKKIGFWLEQGYRTRPSIYEYLDTEIQGKRKMPLFIFIYLHNSPKLTLSMGWQESIIDGTKISGEVIRTDGIWVWTDSIIYYYENHGLILPENFVKHIKSKVLPYPIKFGLKNLLTMGRIKGKIYKKITKEFLKEERKSGIPPQKPSD
jgi:hypothetical protein